MTLEGLLGEAGVPSSHTSDYLEEYVSFAHTVLDECLDKRYALPNSPSHDPLHLTDLVTRLGEYASFKALHDIQVALEAGFQARQDLSRTSSSFSEEDMVFSHDTTITVEPTMTHLYDHDLFQPDATFSVDYDSLLAQAGTLDESKSVYFPPVQRSIFEENDGVYSQQPFVWCSEASSPGLLSLQAVYERAGQQGTFFHGYARRLREESSDTVPYGTSSLSRIREASKAPDMREESFLLSYLRQSSEATDEKPVCPG